MGLIFMLSILCVASVKGDEYVSSASANTVADPQPDVQDTGIELAIAIFRHGDRTPDEEELILYPAADKPSKNIFFPYGMKALTNKGKQRGYLVGKYLRNRYDGLVSKLYLADQVEVRTTGYARTKMSALVALAALYPPPPAQRWNPALEWQPVPYYTPDSKHDDLLYWYYCPKYILQRNKAYKEPRIIEMVKPYQELMSYLRDKTGTNITTPEDVFYFDNLLQTLSNVGVSPPEWVSKVWPRIKEVTKIEYATEFYTPQLIRLASGVLLNDILNYTQSYINGDKEQPKLRLYSAHENNVAALMAASRVFEPHQPNYGATFSLELRKGSGGRYYIAAVYAKDAGGPGKLLSVAGCGGGLLCEYDKFVSLVKEYAWSMEKYNKECEVPSKYDK